MIMRPVPVLLAIVLSTLVTAPAVFAVEAAPLPKTPPVSTTTQAAPTAAEWEPVRVALANNQSDADALLTAVLRRYPNWADGSKTLARRLLDQGKAAEALAAAKRASVLAPTDDEALRIQVRALADLGRKDEIYALVNGASTKDATGWVRYEAGIAAVGFSDAAKADAFLKEAKSRVGPKIPPEFLFLESRVAILARDFPRAELSLASATAQQADFWDGWYELGRVRLVLADHDREQRANWISKASTAFATVVKGLPDDANGHIGLGRTALEEAKLLLADNRTDPAGSKLRDAVVELNRALEKAPDAAEAYVLLGDAQLRLEHWAEAVTALQRAKGLGAKDRSLTFNLAIALQQSGQNDAAQALLKSVTAASPAEQVTIGMSAYRSRNWLLAVNLLASAVDGLEDPATQGPVWRFIGHAESHLAESKTGNAQNAALDAAAEAYRRAGDLHDFPARHFHLATQAARSPELAYAAAWQSISWDTINPTAWGLAIGNYGAAKTGGQGLSGMANRAPLHLALWAMLILLPLAFFVLGLLRRNKQNQADSGAIRAVNETPRQARPPSGKVGGKASGSTTKAPPTKAPVPRTQPPRQPVRPTPRPAAGAKTETEEIVNRAPPAKQKAETIAMAAPPRPSVKPSVKPGQQRPSQIIPPSAADQTMTPTPSPEHQGQALERRTK